MHRAKGDRLVRASVLPVCDNARNVAQCPLHHVNYAATKFISAAANGLGGDT